ncbi:uncharacterized protein PpBr36_10632 [Pyricularia pennisetigena]|uniref:uncharacterized protein n=1 Tax=Pyricularia pennisetigena TaxID=1578925 RepID=UPI00114F8FF0|nr:uncharacterized protein PpBr36_10632 [Pyricularia pennisetigena]TLS21198.1 hypothetical protein PpBr36_10632 [Pyricularia pennisetigena]
MNTKEPIAVVGSACRFPGDATSPSKLWDLLRNPRDVQSEIPPSRFTVDGFYSEDGLRHGATNVRHSYFLSDSSAHRVFDADFFGVKPVEAWSMDPQQRLLLETVYEALEAGGLPLEKLQGTNTGVYVGVMSSDYADLLGRDLDHYPTYFASGTARSILSNRISYIFDWHGPSMTIDTACSSSLVALHQAVQSLRSGEAPCCVVAGANLLLGPEQFIAESKLKMLSPRGRSSMWDKAADGYARGDGIAAVVIKTLSQALQDGDHIECIVRETGINQDGRTKGITMPSAKSQQELIRQTYARAGLDLSKASDRPQYFEAHGTGTPAGDPQEAEGIASAFFGPDIGFQREQKDNPLYVGSIKTIIGHTEGTAGIAGLLKASLAVQHGTIPPNMLFNELSPSVAPFYKHVRISSEPLPWPDVPQGAPRRASLNSFGFGGANAHAVVESYTCRRLPRTAARETTTVSLAPFNFSAATEKSLRSMLESYATHLESKEDSSIDLRQLCWTLNSRRTTLAVRASVPAMSVSDLVAKLRSVNNIVTAPAANLPAGNTSPRILGIFTGQGAQWARMGARLVECSPLAGRVLDELQTALDTLPVVCDRPTWRLRDEIIKDASSSRIGEATMSQSLCTAVQLVVVALLRAAGVKFSAVVGHSSGEMAAAHAAGYLSAGDAMRLAYYRGLGLHLARDGGAMMAVGTSLEDALELCDLLDNKVCVAAVNSGVSVTLSGDAEAMDAAKEMLDDEKKFARKLKVDKAYHSPHMEPAAEMYVAATRACELQLRRPDGSCRWVSSVTGEDVDELPDLEALRDVYWRDNMVGRVQFAQAVEFAVGAHGPFDMCVEVGPHPALKGPTLQTVTDAMGASLPYTGTLSRGKDDVDAFAEALGALWQNLGQGVVDWLALDRAQVTACTAGTDAEPFGYSPPQVIKDLPTYPWQHDREHWHESRYSRSFTSRTTPPHPLLGTRCPDGTADTIRWKNVLHAREIPWLQHHQVEGQIVLPGAAYISAVLEAVNLHLGLGPETESRALVEMQDVVISQALVVPENAGVEALLLVRITDQHVDAGGFEASWTYYSESPKTANAMDENASGRVRVVVTRDGGAESLLPPPHVAAERRFLSLEEDRFYDSVAELGLGYTGPFRGMLNTSRRMDEAIGQLAIPESESVRQNLIVHPATLDCAIQSIILAYCYPGDGRLKGTHMPTKIELLRFDLAACKALTASDKIPFYASCFGSCPGNMVGDVELQAPDKRQIVVQLEGLHVTPFSKPSPADDFSLFSHQTWDAASPSLPDVDWSQPCYKTHQELSWIIERVSYFFMRQLAATFPRERRGELEWYFQHYMGYIDDCLSRVANGTHPFASERWNRDTRADIDKILARYPDLIDLRIARAVGDNIVGAMRGELRILEPLLQDNLLNDFYMQGLGMDVYLPSLAAAASSLAHRFPHMDIFEIGAGTGGATSMVLDKLQGKFTSYTYTDISAGFFEKAQDKFAAHADKMCFKTYDIEKGVREQGYVEGSYDLVVASLVLHATADVEKTLRNARSLLRPGGYLLALELTDNDPFRYGFVFGTLPGWWLGVHEGRTLSPCILPDAWTTALEKTGFGAVQVLPHVAEFPLPLCVWSCQAVDDRVRLLREPTAPDAMGLGIGNTLTIIHGPSSVAESVALNVEAVVSRHYKNGVRHVSSMEEVPRAGLPMLGSVLSLVDLECDANEPGFFAGMDSESLAGFQEVFKQSKSILWATSGALSARPHANMFVGYQRSVVWEMPHVRCHMVNFDNAMPRLHDLHLVADAIAANLVQLEAWALWEEKGESQGMLWYDEPETMVRVEAGEVEVLVPRIKLTEERNQRYNSGRRPLTSPVPAQDVELSITNKKGELLMQAAGARPGRNAKLKLSNSMLRPILTTDKTPPLFVSLGQDSGRWVLALSTSLESHISVPAGWMIALTSQDCDANLAEMTKLYHFLVAHRILEGLIPGSSVAVLDPSRALGDALAAVALGKGLQITLLTSEKSKQCVKPWSYVHPRATRLSASRLLPANASRFVDLGSWEDGSSISALIRSCLPPNCQVLDEQCFLAKMDESVRRKSPPSVIKDVSDHLQAVWYSSSETACTAASLSDSQLPMLNVAQISKPGSVTSVHVDHGQSVLDWNTPGLVEVPTQPASSVVNFHPDKTYWLVGLTGGLGLSLCAWMVDRGARHIALCSRNPKIDADWLGDMSAKGASVRVFRGDVSAKPDVARIHAEITSSMPPIVGVAQGAMVLHDTMFPDLDVERVHKVVRPKVDASLHLSELFSQRGELDWFIFFSSMAYVTGNRGQSVYAAANAFMAALARRRREEGLAASVINIGAIMGSGYVSRELSIQQQAVLRDVGHTWMSEQDFHEIFAEGVLASDPSLPAPKAEMSTGMRLNADKWATYPLFQHLVTKTNGDLEAGAGGAAKSTKAAVKTLLAKAKTKDEVWEIIKDGFVRKLQVALQASPNKDMLGLTADELGIDSLVAVDVRSWFLKELGIDVPVLTILNSPSVKAMLLAAQDLIPADFIPGVAADDGGGTAAESSKPADAAAAAAAAPNVAPVPAEAPPAKTSPKEEKTEAAVTAAESVVESVAHPSESPRSSSIPDERSRLQLRRPSSPISLATTESEGSAEESSGGLWRLSSISAPSASLDPDSPGTGASTPATINSPVFKAKSPANSRSGRRHSKEEECPSHEYGLLTKAGITDNFLKRVLPMSPAQARFWFLQSLADDPTAFNVTSKVRLQGSLDVDRLGRALEHVGQYHEALRTMFATDEVSKKPVQCVLAKTVLHLEHEHAKDERDVDEAVQELQKHVYNLGRGETLRLKLVSLSDTLHYAILGYHHIAVDGVGFRIFFDDLERAYNGSELEGPDENRVQYPDFTIRQMEALENGQWAPDLDYWRSQFPADDLPAPLPLLSPSLLAVHPQDSSFGSHNVSFRVSAATQQRLANLCRRNLGTTSFHFYLAAFRVLLFRLADSKVDDLCIGVAHSGRQDADTIRSLGLFLNLLPLRFRQEREAQVKFGDCLRSVRDVVRDAFAHAAVPIDVLLTELHVPRSSSRPPLFQALFNYRQNIQEGREFCGCRSDGEMVSGGENAYDVCVDVVDSQTDQDMITIGLNKALYTAEAAALVAKSFECLIDSFVKNPATRITWPDLWPAEQVERAVEMGRGRECQSSWPATLIDRIDAMVSKYGRSRVALKDGRGEALTYSQMGQRIDAIASALLARTRAGVKADPPQTVGVFQSPGADWICSLLAVMRSGSAYVALDPLVGPDRLLSIVQDCTPAIILTDDVTARSHAEFLSQAKEKAGVETISVDEIPAGASPSTTPNHATADGVALIAYTSGSTGKPKGIVVTHGCLVNFPEFSVPAWGFGESPQETVLQQSSYAFDMSLGQLVVALCYGGTLVIVPSSQRRDPAAICDIMVREAVTFTLGTPSEFLAWIRAGRDKLRNEAKWTWAVSGGEPMTQALLDGFRSLDIDGMRLFNSYGPSETSFGCADARVPLALTGNSPEAFGVSAAPNYSFYIVDANLKPLPAGIPGEIIVGGGSVAKGYLNRPDQTSKAFVSDRAASPFFQSKGWTRAHRTGDRGRMTKDGSLAVMGRLAGCTQVKVGGIRMDLEDIEKAILQTAGPHVSQAVVSARKSAAGAAQVDFLVAFVVLSPSAPSDIHSYLDVLPRRLPLPQYMRPVLVQVLESIPTTESGKVDRPAVAQIPLITSEHPPSSGAASPSPEEALGEAELRLRELWEEALPAEVRSRFGPIGRDSDFFHIGGSSLALVHLQALIKERMGVSVSLQKMFTAITLGAMTTLVHMDDDSTHRDTAKVDWDAEVSVPRSVATVAKSAVLGSPPRTPPQVVVLTGATGFYGQEILRLLVADKNITTVHCLAVRKSLPQLREHKPAHIYSLFTNRKVVLHSGDLGKPNLGLSPTSAQDIFGQADAIIHNGADVSFMKSYASLRLINVFSTKELVGLALPRRIPFHYVSSATIARLAGTQEVGETSMAPHPPPAEPDDGYTASKWACEVYLERVAAAAAGSWRVVVHRPSSIMGEDTSELDLVSNLVKYANLIKAVPGTRQWKGNFDFVSVETATRMLVDRVLAPEDHGSGRQKGVEFVYETGEMEVGMDEVQQLMEMGSGQDFEVLPVDKWVDEAERVGLSPLIGMYLRSAGEGRILFPKLVKKQAVQ